jgi:hypothetical protein
MISRKINEYIMVVLIGAGSFIFGYLMTFYIFLAITVPPIISSLAFSAASVFLGVCPVILYLGRTLRSPVAAGLITVVYTASLLSSSELEPILIRAWLEYVGIGIYWERVLLATLHVHILDIIFYGLWSVFFGIFVFVLTDTKKKNTVLLAGLFFLSLIVAMGVPNALGFGATVEHEIVRRGIFGVCFSFLVKYFFFPCSWSLFGCREYFHQNTKNDRT